jgi:hypothetical protein
MPYSSFTHNLVSWFGGKTRNFSFGTEETHVYKTCRNRQYSIQNNTHNKPYHLHYLAESFKIHSQDGN